MKSDHRYSKKQFVRLIAVGSALLVAAAGLLVAASICGELQLWSHGAVIAAVIPAIAMMAAAIAIVFLADRKSGCYECPNCEQFFVPTFRSQLIAVNCISKRRLRCPMCGEKSWCKRHLTH